MDNCLKPKFIPETDENLDINTTLFIFAQIVAENVNTKNLLVYYFKQDSHCIFDGVKDMLMKLLSIELSIVFFEREDFYDYSIMDANPHVIFIDDLLEDKENKDSMVSCVPPNTFIISRGLNNVTLSDEIYLPIYKVGKGKENLELVRWNVYEYRRKSEMGTRVSVASVRSEADLEGAREAMKASSMYQPLILVANYPDSLGLKKIVQDERLLLDRNYTFVVFTNNTDITDAMVTQKRRLKADLVFSVLKDGIWGGEYYVPVKNAKSVNN